MKHTKFLELMGRESRRQDSKLFDYRQTGLVVLNPGESDQCREPKAGLFICLECVTCVKQNQKKIPG